MLQNPQTEVRVPSSNTSVVNEQTLPAYKNCLICYKLSDEWCE